MTSVQGTRVLAAFASLGLIVGLGACTTGGTAVESMGVTYSENDVTVATRQMNEILGSLGAKQFSRQDTVAYLTQVQPMLQVAEEQGLVDPTPEYFDTAAQDFLTQVSATVNVTTLSEPTKEILAAQVINTALSNAIQTTPEIGTEILSLMQEPNTHVNPRYLTVSEQGLQAPLPLGDVADPTSSPQS